jgi:hypothetical protein
MRIEQETVTQIYALFTDASVLLHVRILHRSTDVLVGEAAPRLTKAVLYVGMLGTG